MTAQPEDFDPGVDTPQSYNVTPSDDVNAYLPQGRRRIAWKSKTTGYSGHGEWHDERKPLDDWLEVISAIFPDIHHWVETEPSWTELDTSTEDTEIVE